MQRSAIRLSRAATKTENDQAAERPTPSEIRIAAAVIWDVRENIYSWDMAITRAAASLTIPRAAVVHCINRTRDWLKEDADILQEAATMREP